MCVGVHKNVAILVCWCGQTCIDFYLGYLCMLEYSSAQHIFRLVYPCVASFSCLSSSVFSNIYCLCLCELLINYETVLTVFHFLLFILFYVPLF